MFEVQLWFLIVCLCNTQQKQNWTKQKLQCTSANTSPTHTNLYTLIYHMYIRTWCSRWSRHTIRWIVVSYCSLYLTLTHSHPLAQILYLESLCLLSSTTLFSQFDSAQSVHLCCNIKWVKWRKCTRGTNRMWLRKHFCTLFKRIRLSCVRTLMSAFCLY